MDDRKPLNQVTEKTEEVVTEANRVTGGENIDPMHKSMQHFFDVDLEDRNDAELNKQIDELTEWAKDKTGSDDKLYMQNALRKMKANLGFNDRGKPLVNKLHKYVTLSEKMRRLETEMEMIHEHT